MTFQDENSKGEEYTHFIIFYCGSTTHDFSNSWVHFFFQGLSYAFWSL